MNVRKVKEEPNTTEDGPSSDAFHPHDDMEGLAESPPLQLSLESDNPNAATYPIKKESMVITESDDSLPNIASISNPSGTSHNPIVLQPTDGEGSKTEGIPTNEVVRKYTQSTTQPKAIVSQYKGTVETNKGSVHPYTHSNTVIKTENVTRKGNLEKKDESVIGPTNIDGNNNTNPKYHQQEKGLKMKSSHSQHYTHTASAPTEGSSMGTLPTNVWPNPMMGNGQFMFPPFNPYFMTASQFYPPSPVTNMTGTRTSSNENVSNPYFNMMAQSPMDVGNANFQYGAYFTPPNFARDHASFSHPQTENTTSLQKTHTTRGRASTMPNPMYAKQTISGSIPHVTTPCAPTRTIQIPSSNVPLQSNVPSNTKAANGEGSKVLHIKGKVTETTISPSQIPVPSKPILGRNLNKESISITPDRKPPTSTITKTHHPTVTSGNVTMSQFPIGVVGITTNKSQVSMSNKMGANISTSTLSVGTTGSSNTNLMKVAKVQEPSLARMPQFVESPHVTSPTTSMISSQGCTSQIASSTPTVPLISTLKPKTTTMGKSNNEPRAVEMPNRYTTDKSSSVVKLSLPKPPNVCDPNKVNEAFPSYTRPTNTPDIKKSSITNETPATSGERASVAGNQDETTKAVAAHDNMSLTRRRVVSPQLFELLRKHEKTFERLTDVMHTMAVVQDKMCTGEFLIETK